MEKLNLDDNYHINKLSYKKSIENFIEQLFVRDDEYYKNSKMPKEMIEQDKKFYIENGMKNLVIKERFSDPRIIQYYVYCLLGEKELEEFLSLGDEYLSVKKKILKFPKLKQKTHKKLKFEQYKINIKASGDNRATFIILKDDVGSNYMQKILIAKDDIYYAKVGLSNIGLMF